MIDLVNLESLISQGAIYGWEMVLKEVEFLIWANTFLFYGGIVFSVIALLLFVSIPILPSVQKILKFKVSKFAIRDQIKECKTKEELDKVMLPLIERNRWANYNNSSYNTAAGIIGLISIVCGIVIIACAYIDLRHLEINPILHTLKYLFN